MKSNSSSLEPYALLAFLILTPLLSFTIAFIPLPAEVLPLLLVLVPAVLAVLLTAITAGGPGVAALFRKLLDWRVGIQWYAITLALAFGMRLAISILALVLGWIPAIQLRAWPAAQFVLLAAILLISALLEGLGWRAYALPKLLERRTALVTGLLTGVLWGSVHIPLHFPGMIYAGAPWLATVLELVALSVIITWLFVQTRSVLLTVLLHAGQSFFVVINEGISLEQQSWLMVVVYGAVALVLAVAYGPDLRREPVVDLKTGAQL